MPLDLASIAERLSGLTVIEAVKLCKALEEEWGVSASAPAQTAIIPNTTVVEPVVEQTEFTVILAAASPDKKINVIKEVRAITGLGLKEAKDFTESASATKILKESVSKDEAETLKKRIEDAGGTVLIQ